MEIDLFHVIKTKKKTIQSALVLEHLHSYDARLKSQENDIDVLIFSLVFILTFVSFDTFPYFSPLKGKYLLS